MVKEVKLMKDHKSRFELSFLSLHVMYLVIFFILTCMSWKETYLVLFMVINSCDAMIVNKDA